MIAKRKIRCNDCDHEFESEQPENKLRCQCGSMDCSVIGEQQESKGDGSSFKENIKKKKLKSIKTPKIVTLSPAVLAHVDRLVNEKGMFPDMDNCISKAIEMMATQIENPRYIDYIMKGGNIKMSEEEPNPDRELKKIQSQEIIETQMQKKKAEIEVIKKQVDEGKASMSDFTSILKEHLAMKQMQKMIKEMDSDDKTADSNPLKDMKDMMMMQVYANMVSGNNHKGNGESLDLQRKIEDLQRDIREQKILGEVRKLADGNNKGFGTADYLKILADKTESVEKQKLETDKANQKTQEEKDKRIEESRQHQSDETNNRLVGLQDKLDEAKKEGGVGEITKIKEQMTTLRELAKEFGETKEEKSTGEIAADLVMGVAEKLKEPITHVAKAFADKQSVEKMKVQPVPSGTNPNQPTNLGPDVTPVEPSTLESLSPDVTPGHPSPKSEPPDVTPVSPTTSEDQIVDIFSGQNTTTKKI